MIEALGAIRPDGSSLCPVIRWPWVETSNFSLSRLSIGGDTRSGCFPQTHHLESIAFSADQIS